MADVIKVTPELLAAIEKSIHHQIAWGAIRQAGENGRVALALVARIRELEAKLAAATAPTSDAEWAAVLVWAYKEVEAGRSAALEWARPQIDAMLAARGTSHQEWVDKANSWLGGVSGSGARYKPAESVICTDSRGRVCLNGGDFARSRDEGAFPVRWHRVLEINDRKGGDTAEFPADLRVREYPRPREGGAS